MTLGDGDSQQMLKSGERIPQSLCFNLPAIGEIGMVKRGIIGRGKKN